MIGGLVAAGESAYRRPRLDRLPPNALIVALTPLLDEGFATDVLALHRARRPVMVVQMVIADLLPRPADAADDLARRILTMSLADRVDELVGAGVPTVAWAGSGDLEGVVASLARLRRRKRVVS